MNTEQLQRVIQCDTYMKNRIIGVFSADQLPHMQLGSETGLITNTDPTHLPGRHWVAFYLNQQKELECFDSFGNSPAVYSTFLAQFIKGYSKIDINPTCLQSRNTNVCGQYCLLYLMCRCRGLSTQHFYNFFNDRTNTNDAFVYDFIKKGFSCCLHHCNRGQCSVSQIKFCKNYI